jgi:hypothetical protein
MHHHPITALLVADAGKMAISVPPVSINHAERCTIFIVHGNSLLNEKMMSRLLNAIYCSKERQEPSHDAD